MMRILAACVALCGIAVTPSTGQAESGLAPEVLVARVATAYGSISFGEAAEEQALRDLAEALVMDQGNEQARALVEAIQQRRQQRQEQEQQQGQEELERQQSEAAEQQEASANDDRGDESEEDESGEESDSADQDDATRQEEAAADTTGGEPDMPDSAQAMSREEAVRLLDALEQQENAPTTPAREGRGSNGPRW